MLKNYIKIAFKVFLRRKFFTFISLFAISFTLVVLMTFVSLLDSVFGKHPPENKGERILAVYKVEMIGDKDRWSAHGGYKLYDQYLRNINGVERMSLTTRDSFVCYHNGEKIDIEVKRADGEFWKIFDFTFLEGKPFSQDAEKNAEFVAVINKTTRKKFFGTSPAIGKTLKIDNQDFKVIGVVPDVSYLQKLPFSEVWVPISTMKSATYRDKLMSGFRGIFLAKSKSDIPKIKEEFQMRLKKIELPKQYKIIQSAAETEFEEVSRNFYKGLIRKDKYDYRSYPNFLLTIIILMMILFMIVPAINLLNINMSRIMERSSEIGVRKAFGASSITLIGQFIVENILLTIVGGIISFALTQIVLYFISESGFIPYAIFKLNYRVFIYGLAVILFFGIMSGVLPAWRMSRLHPVTALKGA